MGFDKAKAVRAAEKYLAQGKIPAAIQEYERVVGFDPSDFNALNTVGDLYARVENKSDAVVCFRRVAEHYREQGFTLKAVKRARAFTPAASAAILRLHAASTTLGEADEADEVLDRAVKERPGDIEARAMLARPYVEAEDVPRAEAATQELVSRDHSSF